MSGDTRVRWSPEERARFDLAATFYGPPKAGDSEAVWKSCIKRAGVRERPMASEPVARMNAIRSGTIKIKAPEPAPIEKPVVTLREELAAKVADADIAQVEEMNDFLTKHDVVNAAIQGKTPVEEAAPPPPPMQETVAEFISDILLRVLYDARLRKALRDIVTETLAPEAELEQRQGITWREPKTPRERAMRVVIVGGNFGEVPSVPGVDLRYWGGKDYGESTHRLKALLQNCDVAVVRTSGVRHAAMYMVKDREKTGKLKALYWDRPLGELGAELSRIHFVNAGVQ
jgi:hypothetical protein